MPMEVEIKIPAPAGALKARLEREGAEYLGRELQADLYFEHPSRSFALLDEALRIRRGEGRAVLTYKGPKIGAKGKARLELETDLGDADQAAALLDRLGFKPAGGVKKQRDRYRLDGIEISIDRVRGLGEFAELECIVPGEGERAEALRRLGQTARRLGLDPGAEIRKSYLELLLEKRG
jgi:adenylate cyclase class 2